MKTTYLHYFIELCEFSYKCEIIRLDRMVGYSILQIFAYCFHFPIV